MNTTNGTLARTVSTVIAAAAFGVAAHATLAQSVTNANLQAPTVVPVRITTQLSSDESSPGDTVVAHVEANNTPYRSMMRGAVVEGHVVDATPKYGNQPGVLKLRFTELRFADGATTPIDETVTSVSRRHNVALDSSTPVAVVIANPVGYADRSKDTPPPHYKTFAGDTSLPIGSGGNPVGYWAWWLSGSQE